MTNDCSNNGLFSCLRQQKRVCLFLNRLAMSPPPVIILEGGTRRQREEVAIYWAALLNCPHSPPPCGQCQICQHLSSRICRELYFMVPRDESLGVEDIRDIRRIMREKPNYDRIRIFLISEAQNLSNSASNALLKSLEEPLPQNCFVLLTPLRNWLLDTVISRGYVFTLTWQPEDASELQDKVQVWTKRLKSFWQTGKGLFEYTAQKGELDRYLVEEIVRTCQLALIQSKNNPEQLSIFDLCNFENSSTTFVNIIHILHKALESLKAQANPSLVLDWFALQIFYLQGSKQ